MIVRRAGLADAAGIGAVHVAAWRSAYPGILPDWYLAGMSAHRQASMYGHAIRHGLSVHVAVEDEVVGFVTADCARMPALGEGEIETLYVLDDFREQGAGRRLLAAAVADLRAAGCRTAYVWVLRDNPSRWFYRRFGGVPTAEDVVMVAGRPVAQSAFAWDPIDRLADATKE